MSIVRRSLALAAVAALTACATTGSQTKSDDLSSVPRVAPPGALADPKHDNLNAVLWVQTAAENRALAAQAFNLAARTLEAAKRDTSINALVPSERSELPADAPLAIITDIDETVLDGSPFSVDLMQRPIDPSLPPAEGRKQFDQRWADWVAEREARPIPGAYEFLKAADAAGVAIFYVTNRKDSERAVTCENLTIVDFPLKDCATQVLTRNDADGRPKEKGTRRKQIGSKYRVAVMLGDNLGDFVDGIYSGLDARTGLVEGNHAWWGERWIVLPNPMYGSWDEVIGDISKDAASPNYGAEQERRRLLKSRNLRGVDWWSDRLPPKTKSKSN